MFACMLISVLMSLFGNISHCMLRYENSIVAIGCLPVLRTLNLLKLLEVVWGKYKTNKHKKKLFLAWRHQRRIGHYLAI